MIKGKRGGPPVAVTSERGDAGKHSAADDVQRLLVEQWRRQVVREKVAAKQRRLLASPVHPSSLDEITIVTRIGRLRLLRKLCRTK